MAAVLLLRAYALEISGDGVRKGSAATANVGSTADVDVDAIGIVGRRSFVEDGVGGRGRVATF